MAHSSLTKARRALRRALRFMGFPPRLKAGRLYEDTYGNVVGPLIEIEGPTYKFTAPGECRSWTNRGSYLGGTRHGYDLIMEVKK